MFAVIYRGYILPGFEKEYEKLWAEIASFFTRHRGAIGSCLHIPISFQFVGFRHRAKISESSCISIRLWFLDLGCRIHKMKCNGYKTEAGEYIAYSRWPTRETRNKSWGDDRQSDMPARIEEVIQKIKECRDFSKPHDEICMDVVDDLLLQR